MVPLVIGLVFLLLGAIVANDDDGKSAAAHIDAMIGGGMLTTLGIGLMVYGAVS